MDVARVAIVGDFDRRKHSHWATDAALFHAGARLGTRVEPHWIGTPTLADAGNVRRLWDFDGVWGAPGSPYASMPGILNAIEYARERDVPYLGTCAGFQYALIEFSRNVLGIRDADSAENNPPNSANVVIRPIYCVDPAAAPGTPRFAGPGVARPTPGSMLEAICGSEDSNEEYFCSLEANADFVPRWEHAGLRVAARGQDGEIRAFELPLKRFFVAALFQPQLSSSYESPHPLIAGFLRACTGRER